MKLLSLKTTMLLAVLMLGFASCDDVLNPKDDELFVRFYNESGSNVSITNIQLQPRGSATAPDPRTDNWSANILPDGKKLAPGEYFEITLNIPNLEWSEYRLGVDPGTGTELMLYTQENEQYPECPITHWGGDDRTVRVTVVKDDQTGYISVRGWSDWVGID